MKETPAPSFGQGDKWVISEFLHASFKSSLILYIQSSRSLGMNEMFLRKHV